MARRKLAVGGHGDISVKRIDGTAQWRARVRYRDAVGTYHFASAKGATKREAERVLRERLVELTGTTQVAAIQTVADLCGMWLERARAESEAFWSRPDAATRLGTAPARPQSLVHHERAFRYICARPGGIGDLRLEEVTTHILESWLWGHVRQSRGRAAEIRIALRLAFRTAVRLGLLTTDPMAGVSAVARNDPRPLALTAEELRLVRSVLKDATTLNVTRTTAAKLDALLVVLLGTGMRVGEAAALRWGDVALSGPTPMVSVTGTQVEITGKGVIRQDATKTEASRRDILLPPAVVEALLAVRPERWKPTGWVFPTRNGSQWNTGNAAKVLRRVVDASAGRLDPHRVSFHKFRSTAATAIAERHGADVAAQVLGHKPTGVTRSHYIARPTLVPDVRGTLQRLVEASIPISTSSARRHLKAV